MGGDLHKSLSDNGFGPIGLLRALGDRDGGTNRGGRGAPWLGLGGAFAGLDLGERFFEDAKTSICLVRRNDQRWRESHRVVAATQEEEPFLEGEIHDGVPGYGVLTAFRIQCDNLRSQHEPEATHITDQWMFLHQPTQGLGETFSLNAGILDIFFFEKTNRSEGGSTGDRVSAEGAGVGARQPIHD